MSDGGGGASAAYQKLPPGWDCKYDQATGNCYFINYFTKAMQLEDPRSRYKQLENERCSTESIALQHMVTQPSSVGSGSGNLNNASPYHVYPSNSLTAVRAFQDRHSQTGNMHNRSSSPLLGSRGHSSASPSPLPLTRAHILTHTPRLGHQHMSRRQTIQETSFTNQIDTDAVVTKIQNMFPTAGENHIRLLLKRYYNREAVVISALQVEKHPVTMPGPYVTPPSQRHLFHSNSTFYMTPPACRLDLGASRAGGLSFVGFNSRTASPIPGGRFGSAMSMQSGGAASGLPMAAIAYHGSPRFHPEQQQWRSSPKPHSSPKMKLRYMKNIFPKADEMLLLDILANADNNVQIASEKLISMGYVKRDFVPAKPNNRPPAVELTQMKNSDDERIIPLRPKEYTLEEKESMQELLKEKYPKIAERIILMALESVNYAEDRAIQILQIVQEEDDQHDKKLKSESEHQVNQTVPLIEAKDEETVTDGNVDSILTVVVETSSSPAANASSLPQPTETASTNKTTSKHISLSSSSTAAATTTTTITTTTKTKKYKYPSINVTTPTTATTQIILSSSPIEDDNDNDGAPIPLTKTAKPLNEIDSNTKQDKNSSSISLASPSPSPSTTLSTHSYASPTQSPIKYTPLTTKSILARSSGYASASGIINGYLHGSSLSSSYSSYTSMKLSSSSSTSSSTSTSSATALLAGKLTTAAVCKRARTKSDTLKNSQRGSTTGGQGLTQREPQGEFKSIIDRMRAMGHNSELAKGPDENLLLEDYITWNGANPTNTSGQRLLANGPDPGLLSERGYKPMGRNPELCKGAKAGLAKGSIYKSANIKCN